MMDRLRRFILPTYLLLCLVLGGSVQGIWNLLVLQLLAIALIAWAALSRGSEAPVRESRGLILIFAAMIALLVIQMLPLPPQVWTSLPGRAPVAGGFEALGFTLPWLPVSMAPYATLAAALALLPPAAILLWLSRLGAPDDRLLAAILLVGTFLGILLGAVQTLGGLRPDAWWYPYRITNEGAVGFFANRNHMGTLLLVSIPFTLALVAAGRTAAAGGRGRAPGLLLLGIGGLLLAAVGLALNRSLAAMVLALPVVAFSTMLLAGTARRQRLLLGVAALLTLAAAAVLTSSPVRSELSGADSGSFESRVEMWSTTWTAVRDVFPVGSGIGSFEQVYRLHEDPGAVGAIYVNHAHNDYLELLLETGLAGLLLLAVFLFWWLRQTWRIWRSAMSSNIARAASIASGTILLHSMVDYPLRTTAITAVLALCLALMAQPVRASRGTHEKAAIRPTKHLAIG